MTEKLYYKDAYIKEFCAEVVSVAQCDEYYDVVLDRTAFFPEEGGQSADRGHIGEVSVVSAYEKDGIVHHLTDGKLALGKYNCTIDFDERFEKMQCHTAEHLLCGIIHRLYGLDNVGFHLGEDIVTFDISAPLTREELDIVESMANEAVFANIKVETYFPSAEHLPTLEYRSKLELVDNVRIVKIGEVDSCACCAPHVAYTGEIGVIKILDFEKHRGGLRIIMTAGRRAVLDYRKKYENIKRISALLSEPQHVTADALEKHIQETERIKSELKGARLLLARERAVAIEPTDLNALYYFPDFSMDELREFANVAKDRVGQMLAVLGGDEGDYKYVIMSNSVNLSQEIKYINEKLSGKGGGKPMMVQGSFYAKMEDIKQVFLSGKYN